MELSDESHMIILCFSLCSPRWLNMNEVYLFECTLWRHYFILLSQCLFLHFKALPDYCSPFLSQRFILLRWKRFYTSCWIILLRIKSSVYTFLVSVVSFGKRDSSINKQTDWRATRVKTYWIQNNFSCAFFILVILINTFTVGHFAPI